MIQIIKRWFCKHKFDLIYHADIYNACNGTIPLGEKYVYVCSVCLYKRVIKTF